MAVTYIDPRHKALWHMDRLAQLRDTGRTAAPVNVEIDLSNRCSLGCQWCHFAYTHTRGPLANTVEKPKGYIAGGDLMLFDLAQRILLQLADAGVKSITWTGGGEPTLHPEFDKIVRFATVAGLEQGLYTHGGHVSAERAALLKQHLTWVYVSLDECTLGAYQASKGVDRFEQACDGIRNLAQAEGSATVGVGFLIHRDNYTHVSRMAALAKALGADYCQMRPTVHYRQGAPGERAEDVEWMADAVRWLRPLEGDPFVVADLERFEAYRTWQGHGYGTCNWSALQTVITPNGKVWTCVNKRERADALLGDLAIEDFADVWARAGACAVDGACRVMCRGHFANLTLAQALTAPKHANFP